MPNHWRENRKMGKIIDDGNRNLYQQKDGEITAWFRDVQEKMELRHEGTAYHKKIFYLMVVLGCIYLIWVFALH
jgi:hypothetical protein